MGNHILEENLKDLLLFEYFAHSTFNTKGRETTFSNKTIDELIEYLNNINEDEFIENQFVIETILDRMKGENKIFEFLEIPSMSLTRFKEYDAVIFYIVKRKFNIHRIIRSRWNIIPITTSKYFESSVDETIKMFSEWDDDMIGTKIYAFTLRLIVRSVDRILWETPLYDENGNILEHVRDLPSDHYDKFEQVWFSDKDNTDSSVLSIGAKILWVLYYEIFEEISRNGTYTIALGRAGAAYPYIEKIDNELVMRFSRIINDIKKNFIRW